MSIARAGLLILFATALGGLPSPARAAVSLVTSAAGITADGTINWSVLGPNLTQVSEPFTVGVAGIAGLTAAVSQATGFNFQRRDQAVSWNGNFAPGTPLLWSQGANGPDTMTFNSPVQGVGFQIQRNLAGAFTASITAYNGAVSLGTFTEPGNSTAANDGSAIFLGVLSTSADITRIVYNVNTSNFAIGPVRVQAGTTAVPEPTSILLLATTAAFVVTRIRKKV